MTQKNGARDPHEEAAAGALKAFRAGPVPISEDDLIMNDFDADYLLARQYPSGCWLHSPANMEVLSAGVSGLQKNGTKRGIEGKVTKVRAAKVKHKKHVYIWATADDDPDGIPVNYYRHAAWINLITLLGPLKLTEKTGYKTRYSLEPTGDESPVGPALVLNLSRKLERRREEKKSSKKSKPKADQKAPEETEAPEQN